MSCMLVSGLNLRKAMEKARRLGAIIESVPGTGEYRFRHPMMNRPCRVDGRRKDAPRHLCVWLRHLGRMRQPADESGPHLHR